MPSSTLLSLPLTLQALQVFDARSIGQVQWQVGVHILQVALIAGLGLKRQAWQRLKQGLKEGLNRNALLENTCGCI